MAVNMRKKRVSILIRFVAALAVLAPAACSGGPGGGTGQAAAGGPYATVQPVGADITVAVSPAEALSVYVPGAGRITGPAGAFAAAGTITIRREKAAFAPTSGLQAAGTGVDVVFHHTALRKPLTVIFDTGNRPGSAVVPAIAHRADDGTWSVRPAARDAAGRFTVITSAFSINIPSWANPLHWWRSLRAAIASGVGGRTGSLTCSGAPGWFHLSSGHSDLVHVCAKTNHTSDGQQVAEVQIKSNRGVSLEVAVPGNPSYVWVQDESWAWRQKVAAAVGFDPNRTVILAAGATMTVGYRREYTAAPFSFFITGATLKAAVDTVFRGVDDIAAGTTNATFIGYSEAKCAAGLGGSPLSGADFGVASFEHFLSCWTGEVTGVLKNPQNALQVASQFGGGEQDVAELVRHAKAVNGLGWLVTLWPAVQLGIGNDIDKIRELLSGGQTALVTYHMDPQPAPARSGGHATQGQPATGPAVRLAQGPAAPQGYRYAVTLTGFPATASVAVTCYDSVNPGGFYTFHITTDQAGSAFAQSQCYSGDGPDHWVTAAGHKSNHVRWGSSAPTAPSSPPPPPPPSTRPETTGGVTHTWSNYTNAGGTQGPTIPAYATVQITCKVTGFKVADGNTWWYRIASPGWNNNFYASADAFYNNGQKSGSLRGTPWVDNAVPNC
jgi:hypothetical protein